MFSRGRLAVLNEDVAGHQAKESKGEDYSGPKKEFFRPALGPVNGVAAAERRAQFGALVLQ